MTFAVEKDGLTARQAEVFALLAQGLTRKEIADKLVINVETVRSHCRRIFKAVGVRNRTELALVWWSRQGSLQLPAELEVRILAAGNQAGQEESHAAEE